MISVERGHGSDKSDLKLQRCRCFRFRDNQVGITMAVRTGCFSCVVALITLNHETRSFRRCRAAVSQSCLRLDIEFVTGRGK